jgi:ABC-type transport system involved in cytochrome bd biosynthesis fused ATPase/permease subunit
MDEARGGDGDALDIFVLCPALPVGTVLEVEPIEDEVDVQITLPTPFGVFDKNEKMLGIADVSFKWNDADKEPLFEGVDFVVKPRARIAIMGKNGCGKTSLLNILTGECPPTTGTVSKHIGCRIQMLQQHHYKGTRHV